MAKIDKSQIPFQIPNRPNPKSLPNPKPGQIPNPIPNPNSHDDHLILSGAKPHSDTKATCLIFKATKKKFWIWNEIWDLEFGIGIGIWDLGGIWDLEFGRDLGFEWDLEFGIWVEFGIWDLGYGI
ncbi:hypothetical protein C2G38_2193106 [Gigaspora rosea]|uniref:Uncharacterized protein n=1 Tax=Gigaspora rosea TaxID=44941 RepID=A0A397V5F2_9GLOM|nr:hypothetical protein C2G38_2193106 [Gigaspora rosea]